MSTNTGALIESCNFKILSLKINGEIINQNYINDLSIDWNGEFRIFGYCTINDHFDLINTMLATHGQKIILEYTDNYDVKFKRTFIILNSTEVKEQDFKTVTLQFQDVISFKLQKTFIAKSYQETTLIDILNEYITEVVDTDLEAIIINEGEFDEIKFKNFVVPLHIDFLSFIIIEFAKAGIWLYQTKFNITIGNIDIDETPEYPYKQVGGKDLYGFKIIEYDLMFNNIKKTNQMQKSDVLVFDKNTKSMTHYDKSLEDFLPDYQGDGVALNSQLTNGTQLKTKEYLIDTALISHIGYKSNTEMHIIVPGNIDYSILYKDVNVKISGGNYTIETREKGDIKLTGKYQISRVEDKFLAGQKFIQRLTLRRLHEGKE